MKVASLTVNYKTADLTVRAVEAALADLEPLGGKAIVVDNDSQDGSVAKLEAAIEARGWRDKVVLIASERNLGFGGGNNVGFRHALAWDDPPDLFYLLNPDARPAPGAIGKLVDFMAEHREVGLAGTAVRFENGALRPSAFRFPGVLSEIEAGLKLELASRLLDRYRVWLPTPTSTGPVDWVSGASFVIRREVLETVGMFDETFFLYFEETELCLRALRAGWPTYCVVEAEAEHIGNVSTQFRDHTQRRARYWFDSRQYYLYKVHGPLKAWAADVAFVGSRALYQVRRRLQRKPDDDPPYLLSDFVRHRLSTLTKRPEMVRDARRVK